MGLISQNLVLFGHNCLFLLRRPKIELLWQMNNFSVWKKVVLSNQVVGQWQGRVRKLTLQLSANELHFWYNIKRTSRLVKVKEWIWGQLHKIWGGRRVFIYRYKLYKYFCSSRIFSILSFGLKILKTNKQTQTEKVFCFLTNRKHIKCVAGNEDKLWNKTRLQYV